MTTGSARDAGMATVTALVLLFAFTAGALVWFARDVDRTISNRSVAQSIAFQAARAGAQQVELEGLRSGESAGVDGDAARTAVWAVAADLFDGYAVLGRVSRVTVEGSVVEVSVQIDDPAGDVIGVAAARAEVGP